MNYLTIKCPNVSIANRTGDLLLAIFGRSDTIRIVDVQELDSYAPGSVFIREASLLISTESDSAAERLELAYGAEVVGAV
jgi:hypothetical protein